MAKGDVRAELKAELDPLIKRLETKAKDEREFQRLKKNFWMWHERFLDILEISGAIESIPRSQTPSVEKLETNPADRKVMNLIGLFRYLGLVEGLGSSLLDLVILLAVADGCDFHVERIHDYPRIIHAIKLDDLKRVSLRYKLDFLERHEYKKTVRIVDRDLRNDIAHLKFRVTEDGEIKIKRKDKWRTVNVFKKIDTFNNFSRNLRSILKNAQYSLGFIFSAHEGFEVTNAEVDAFAKGRS